MLEGVTICIILCTDRTILGASLTGKDILLIATNRSMVLKSLVFNVLLLLVGGVYTLILNSHVLGVHSLMGGVLN